MGTPGEFHGRRLPRILLRSTLKAVCVGCGATSLVHGVIGALRARGNGTNVVNTTKPRWTMGTEGLFRAWDKVAILQGVLKAREQYCSHVGTIERYVTGVHAFVLPGQTNFL